MRTELRMLEFWLRRRAAHGGATPTTTAAEESATTPAWHFESVIRYIIIKRNQTIIDSLHSILKTLDTLNAII